MPGTAATAVIVRRGAGADFALAPSEPGFVHPKQDKLAQAARAKLALR